MTFKKGSPPCDPCLHHHTEPGPALRARDLDGHSGSRAWKGPTFGLMLFVTVLKFSTLFLNKEPCIFIVHCLLSLGCALHTHHPVLLLTHSFSSHWFSWKGFSPILSNDVCQPMVLACWILFLEDALK